MKSRAFAVAMLIMVACQLYGYNKVEKIGIIDLTEVFDKFLEGKEIAKEFNEYKKYSEEKLENMRKELNNIRTKIIQISNTIKETNIDYQTSLELSNLSKEYELKVENYINEIKNTEEKLNKFRDSLKQYVYKDLLNYIKSYGDRNGFSIILDTRGNLIFYSKGNDITQNINKWIKVQEDAKKKY